MKKIEFIEILKSHISENKESFKNDKVAICTYFNDLKDMYHKDSEITDSQIFSWILTNRELNSILKMCKSC